MSPRGVPPSRLGRPHAEKFMAKVDIEPRGCWRWMGYVQSNGYGYYRHEESTWAHRVSYLLFRGPIPEGLTIDHLCRNKRCVNPDHLEVVTQSENSRRATPWTKCATYHPRETSRWSQRADGRQTCLECGRVREQQRRDQRALGAARVSDPPAPHGGNEERPTYT